MKYNNFAKYIPITEDEYQVFKEQQRKDIKHAEEELTRPDALIPLVEAQKEKTHTLFDPTKNAELQEKRFAHITSVINGLKRKVEERQEHQELAIPSQPIPLKLGKREEALSAVLNNDIWNANGELMVNGNAVPNSNKRELLNYAASNWATKYLHKVPKGGEQFRQLLLERNIPRQLLNNKLGVQPEIQPSTSQGLASGKKQKPAPVTPYRNTDLEKGLEFLNSSTKKYRKKLSFVQ